MKGLELKNGWNWIKPRKSSKPCKPSKLSKPRKQMDNGGKTLKSDMISNLRKGLPQLNVNIVKTQSLRYNLSL